MSTNIGTLVFKNTDFPLLTETVMTQEGIYKDGNDISFTNILILKDVLPSLKIPPNTNTLKVDNTILLDETASPNVNYSTHSNTELKFTSSGYTNTIQSNNISVLNNTNSKNTLIYSDVISQIDPTQQTSVDIQANVISMLKDGGDYGIDINNNTSPNINIYDGVNALTNSTLDTTGLQVFDNNNNTSIKLIANQNKIEVLDSNQNNYITMDSGAFFIQDTGNGASLQITADGGIYNQNALGTIGLEATGLTQTVGSIFTIQSAGVLNINSATDININNLGAGGNMNISLDNAFGLTTNSGNIDIISGSGADFNILSGNSINASSSGGASINLSSDGSLNMESVNGNIELTVPNTGGEIRLNGTDLLSNTSGGSSGQHLVITINGNQYKIKLENP